MVYRYDQILTKKNTGKFILFAVALVSAVTLMMNVNVSVSAVAVNGCSFDDSTPGLWLLEGDCTVTARIDIPAGTTVDGDGHTISASFDKTTNSNNAALGVIGANGVSIENLTIDGTGGNPWPLAIHGINTYKSEGVTISNVTVTNMSASGIVVNGSTVAVSDVTTSGNGWHGINVDQGSGVTEPSVLNINGVMHQTDLLQIYVDDAFTKDVTVNDTLPQYTVAHINLRGTHPNDELYTLDTAAPSIPVLTWPIDGVVTNDNTPLMQWDDSTDNLAVAGYYYRVYYHCSDESNVPASCSSVYPNATGLWHAISEYQAGTTADGTYFWQVRAVDTAGNQSDWSGLEKVVIDTVAPGQVQGMTIYKGTDTSGPNLGCSGYTNNPWITVDWNDSDDANFAYYRYQVKNGWSTILTASQRTGMITGPDGEYRYRVQAVDKAGNVGDYSEWCYVTLDTVAPVVDVTSHSNGDYVNGTVNVEGTITDTNNHHYWFVIYDSSNHNIAGPGVVNDTNSVINASFSWDTTAVPDGDYTIKLEARDQADNKDASSVEWVNVTVDNTAPTITLTAPENGDVVHGVMDLQAICDEECDYINFWWRAEGDSYSNTSPEKNYHYIHDNGTMFDWSLDTLNAERWGGDPSYTMSDGTYYFKAAGKDVAGNWARTPETMITIVGNAPGDTDDCKKGGWENYVDGLNFRNQGDCVSYVVSEKQHEDNPDGEPWIVFGDTAGSVSLGASHNSKKH